MASSNTTTTPTPLTVLAVLSEMNKSAMSTVMGASEVISLSKKKAYKLSDWDFYIYKINRYIQKNMECFTLVYKNNNSLVYESTQFMDEVNRFVFTFQFRGDSSQQVCKCGFISFHPAHYDKIPISKTFELLDQRNVSTITQYITHQQVLRSKTPRKLYKTFKNFLDDYFFDSSIDLQQTSPREY